MKKLLKWTGIIFVGFIVLIIMFSKSGNESFKRGKESGRAQTSNKTTSQSEEKSSTPLERIKAIVADVSGGTVEPVMFNGDDIGTESNAPYQVVINYPLQHTISSCDTAKRVSYSLIEALYKDQMVRGAIQRVLVSIPNYLRTSLGAKDGLLMAEKGSFSGPTNYWKVMSDPSFSSEKEDGNMEDRTWGKLLTKCQ